ncbi:enterobactin synthetase component F [Gibbsiella quercinecans]|uniref:Carrier domain-containing protein n=2 Tax=Gibbsiella quercinecans TaxID=929813 RepID=A0A250B2U4_9GAMM|nr:hypothetical protein AWC35_14270 [Gibbsiella quercinecans]RLM03058.1 hypothetical protein BIY30_22765 [Gibbsiella quercinecans]TCT88172.1 enterobactin synthetase component F [Gibbsiella quercinecans]
MEYSSGIFPLTDAQLGVWYASLANNSSRLYVTGQCLQLSGDIVIPILLQAIKQAISEIEVLNYSYIDNDGIPSFDPDSRCTDLDVALHDLRMNNNPEIVAQQLIEQIVSQESGLDSLHEHINVLYLVHDHKLIWFSRIHHVAFDAYAYYMFHRRAGENYNSLLLGEVQEKSQFTDLYTLCEEDLRYRKSTQFLNDNRYWKQLCADLPTPTFLGGLAQDLTTETIQFEEVVEDDLSQTIELFYQRNRIALSDIFLSIFTSYFSLCLSGERRLVFGLPCMNRQDSFSAHAAITRSNILPLILYFPDGASFKDVCSIVAKSRKELLKHQRYRGEWIARDIGRVGDTLPLYGIELNILPSFPAPDFSCLNTKTTHTTTGPVRDINVHLELGENFRPRVLRLIANASRHSQKELQLHVRRLLHWTRQLIKAPELSLRELPFAMPVETDEIAKWNNTEHVLKTNNILELFYLQAQENPHQIAVMDESRSLTYSELEKHSWQYAQALDYYLNGANGKVIGLALERSVELEILLLAILRAGAIILPLSLEIPQLRLKKMLKQAGAALTISNLADQIKLPSGYPLLAVESLALIAEQSESAPRKLPSATSGHAPAYILFTSGSSGEPKGVMVGHLALANRLQWMLAEYKLNQTDRVLQKTPVTFDVSIWEFFLPLIGGATLVMARPGGHRDPFYLLGCIKKYNITTLHFVPSMLGLFLDALEFRPTSLPLRRVFVSGEALTSELVGRYNLLQTVPLHNLYGPTEAAIDVTYYAVQPENTEKSVPIGRPIWNTKIHILSEDGKTLPIGMAGELYIEGICLADGYVSRPDLTAERFVTCFDGSRCYRTGDLARWRFDGEVDYLGRLDQQVKIHGQRIELEEIDAVIGKHPKVLQACTNIYAGRIVAYIVATRGAESYEQEIQELCRDYLPVYMQPQQIVFLNRFPLSPNGKLDRKAFPAPPAYKSEDGGVPSSLLEQRICEYFADALELPSIAPDANFFNLGGNSLSAVSVATRINAGLGWNISIATIFAHPTPKALAGKDKYDDLNMLDTVLLLRPAPHPSQKKLPTLFCVHPAGGIAWCYSGLARFLKTPCEIVGLQAKGLTSGSNITNSMDEMAQEYVEHIRARQPKGPYWLIGWSVGGMIAHKIATYLEKQGQKVQLLAMMDSYPSDLWRRFAFEDLNMQEEESMALAALLFIAGIALPFNQELPSLIVPKGETLKRQQTIELLRKNGNALASLDDQILDRLINVVINSRRLVGGSSHDIYHGDMLFFTAASPRAESWLDIEAWRPYVRGKINNIDINCDHPGMARTEALREIARYLDEVFVRFGIYSSPNLQSLTEERTTK